MNQGWLIFCMVLLTSVGFIGERYGENRVKVQCDKHDEAQQQVTIAAENSVIAKEHKSADITNKTEMSYDEKIAAIEHDYAVSVQPNASPASDGVPKLSKASCGTRPVSRPRTSKTYKLTFEQCDKLQAGFNALWHDWEQQSQ